jgi:acyl-coenzyme A synthetase/AMP-(fatty) acid ligase/3-hydroxymyristoyl/3-hydroxydecanoyl-(acyl carrier protein) dehydratase
MNGLIPLGQWLADSPERVVACEQQRQISKSQLAQRVRTWQHCLPARKGERWAVFHPDTMEFLALLLALWQRGVTACVPGDNLPATTRRLERCVDGFAGAFPRVGTVMVPADAVASAPEESWGRLEPGFHALEIYTSGSTGEPKPILKTIADLDYELAALEQLWPDYGDAVVISTVTHQHLFGLTFRLLWPLSRGQIFECNQCQYTEDVYRQALHHASFLLVATPSHLGRINPELSWERVAEHCAAVISSAAPLRREDSLTVSRLLNAPVREIYGSSETGAIAWRVQQEQLKETLWRPLPGVTFNRIDGTMYAVQGAHIPAGHPLSDQLEMGADGYFRLLGRVDRIAKVEGKRVSLAEIEQAVEQHQYVRMAKALVVTRKRSEIALVVELSDTGQALLGSHGKRELQKRLRAVLQERFETVLLPRKWRFVARMPHNSQGKLPQDMLQAMFDPDVVKWPDLIRREVADHRAELVCRVPAGLVYFDGHFDGNPILPGIVQVHWAEHFAREWLPVEGRFRCLEVIKFQQVIFPEAVVSISLEYNPEKRKLGFSYSSDRGVHSSGRICFG